jgi:hypothetical protein
MKKAARWFGGFLCALLVVGQIVSLGVREGWGVALFAVCFVVALCGSLVYGLSED